MAVTLELEMTNEKGTDVFYRYVVGGFQFWFTQDVNNGNIYSVSIRARDAKLEDFELYAFTNEGPHGGYYPDWFELRGPAPSMTTNKARTYVENMLEACAVLDEIEAFFKNSFHYDLYRKNHQ